MSISRSVRASLALLPAAALACASTTGTGVVTTPPPAVERGAFLVRLGDDTVAAERFTRTATRLEGDNLIRSAQQTEIRHYTIDYRGDTIIGMEVVRRRANQAADAPPFQRITVAYTGDSATVTTFAGDSSRVRRVPATPTSIPTMGLMYAPFELAFARAQRRSVDSTAVSVYTLGAAGAEPHPISRVAPDSMVIVGPFYTWRVRLGPEGRILGLHAPGTTFQIRVERLDTLDFDALVRQTAARPLGQLSPRDTARATLGAATVWVDYGRPMRRGREIFGNIVRWNEVWRSGANQATQFSTDRPLVIGGTQVPAGTYTLWTLPSPTGWKLILNRQIGQWGTVYDQAQDLARIDMQTRTLANPVEQLTYEIAPTETGGVLRLTWDRMEASVPITVP